MSGKNQAEEELGRRWDRCLADFAVKLGAGAAIGVVGSLLLFKRRAWPVVMGSGFGLGLAYGNCQHDLNAAITIQQKKDSPALQSVGVSVGLVITLLTVSEWPLLLGAGVGLGLAYDHCDSVLWSKHSGSTVFQLPRNSDEKSEE